LVNEQQELATWLSAASDRVRNQEATAWDEITEAIKYFEDMGYAIPKAG